MSEHATNRITRIFDEHRQANTKALDAFLWSEDTRHRTACPTC